MARGRPASMTLPVHWATPYLRVRVTSGDVALVVEDRRTLFGVVPIRRRRLEVPYTDLETARIKNAARWSCLIPVVAVVASIVVAGLPVLVDVALALVGILLLLMTFIRGIYVKRTDGRSWTFPICRTHEFDASLAVLDALHRRDVARSSTP